MNYYQRSRQKRQQVQRKKAIKKAFNTFVNYYALPVLAVIIAYIVLLLIAV